MILAIDRGMIDGELLSSAILTAEAAALEPISRAICDTVAVAAAGFAEPVTVAVAQAYRGNGTIDWTGRCSDGHEAAVMINAVAGHALDFDDVYLDSHVHASTVLTPVVLQLGETSEEVAAGFSAGLVAVQVMAAALGPDHYGRGWHGTGTIGAFGAAAAAARLLQLDLSQTQSALALTAAMAGGLQANFGTMAKPCQAGFAAAAGLRAARLAKAGVSGASDALGVRGFTGLYGGAAREVPLDAYVPHPERMSVKLFPSCFAAARLVGVALDSRSAVAALLEDPATTLRLVVPAGSLAVLRYDRPRTGAEARFSATYNVARALCGGVPVIDDFEDEAVADRAVAACMARISVEEDPAQHSGGDIRFGTVRLEARRADTVLATFKRRAIPGSPEDPATAAQLDVKWQACLSRFRAQAGTGFPVRRILAAMPSAAARLEVLEGSSPTSFSGS